MLRIAITTLASIALATGAPASGCGGGKTASPDGRYLFTKNGRIAYDKTIRAHGGGGGCRWRVETEPLRGLKKNQEPHVIKRGDLGNAKITQGQPDSVKVYLVSEGCGKWS